MKNKLFVKEVKVLSVFALLTILSYRTGDLSVFRDSSSSLILCIILMMILTGFIPAYLKNGNKSNLGFPLLGIVTGVVLDSIYDLVCRGIDRNLIGFEIVILLLVLGPMLAIVFFFANSAFLSKKKNSEALPHD